MEPIKESEIAEGVNILVQSYYEKNKIIMDTIASTGKTTKQKHYFCQMVGYCIDNKRSLGHVFVDNKSNRIKALLLGIIIEPKWES